MIDETLTNKIRKLLSLAKSDNKHESELALLKAKQFAVENGIDLAAIEVAVPVEKMERKDKDMGQRMPICQRWSSSIVQKHFGCRVIYSGSRFLGRRVVLLGKESDVEIASYILDFLNRAMLSAWNEDKKRNNLPLSHREGYLYGYYCGLDDKLTKEAEESKKNKLQEISATEGPERAEAVGNKYALVLKTDSDKLEDFVRQNFTRLRTTAGRSIRVNSTNTMSLGKAAGAKCNLNRAIKGSGQLSLA